MTNALDGPHAFIIPGAAGDAPMVDTGPIPPGETGSVEFEAKEPGTYLYYDNLNAPVNRVMGLHGAFVVMPAQASGERWTPYKNPPKSVQTCSTTSAARRGGPGWPGKKAIPTPTPSSSPSGSMSGCATRPVRCSLPRSDSSPRTIPARTMTAANFMDLFVHDPFINTSNDARSGTSTEFPGKTPIFNRKPHFFTINGQSGLFAHNNAAITPMHRVGEPALIRILNAGLMAHSMHLHANHFFVTAINNEPSDNPLWLDVFHLHPMDHIDYTIPFMRPPDIPNVRGIGRADLGLASRNGTRAWPPVEEFERHHPQIGERDRREF